MLRKWGSQAVASLGEESWLGLAAEGEAGWGRWLTSWTTGRCRDRQQGGEAHAGDLLAEGNARAEQLELD